LSEQPHPNSSKVPPAVPFGQAVFPVLVLAFLIVYGLIVRPMAFGESQIPLEIIFILAASIAVCHQLLLGFRWLDIQTSIVNKLSMAMPAFLILFSIGLIIASWIVCGTIPMLVYWGLRLINPDWIYLVAFVAPMVFSTLTGTSWGSVGTIGVVLIGIAGALDANLGITAGAIIGGAYFGDKMSPLSDTTILASMATEISVYEHIHSMMFTTIPSMLIAGTIYGLLGFWYPPAVSGTAMNQLQPFLDGLQSLFFFNPLLLLPPAIVLWGSLRKMPTVPVLILSVIVACLLAFIFQGYSVANIFQSVYKGFDTTMATWVDEVPDRLSVLLNRGGLYALNDAIITAFMVFIFIGAIDNINAMPTVVNGLLGAVKSQRPTIVCGLLATAVTNAMTSNQYATTFIVGDAFKSKFDALKIPRKVLSRSIEDTGTMIESLIPWTTTSLYMVATLGVAWSDYWHWQLLSLINIFVAFTLATTGIGCFLNRPNDHSPSTINDRKTPQG
jgi:NhaC family Na+:H+ antiporter